MRISLSFFFLLALFGCNNLNPEAQALWDEVMKLHDDSMLNHGVMMKNTAQIRKKLKSGDIQPTLLEAISPALEKIDAADEAMMSWMHDLKGPVKLSGKSHEEIMSYLQGEKVKIEKIDKDIIDQLTISRNILNVLEPQVPPNPTQ